MNDACRLIFSGHSDDEVEHSETATDFSNEFTRVIYARVPRLDEIDSTKMLSIPEPEDLTAWHLDELLTKWPSISSAVYRREEILCLMPPNASMAVDEEIEATMDVSMVTSPITSAASSVVNSATDSSSRVSSGPDSVTKKASNSFCGKKQSSLTDYMRQSPQSSSPAPVAKKRVKSQLMVPGASEDDVISVDSRDEEEKAMPAAKRRRKAASPPPPATAPLSKLMNMGFDEYTSSQHGINALPLFHSFFGNCLPKDNLVDGVRAFIIFHLLIQLGKAVPCSISAKNGDKKHYKHCFMWIMLRFRSMHERDLIAKYRAEQAANRTMAWNGASSFVNRMIQQLCDGFQSTLASLRGVPPRLDKVETDYPAGHPLALQDKSTRILPQQWGFNLNTAVNRFLFNVCKALINSILTTSRIAETIELGKKPRREDEDDEAFYRAAFKNDICRWIESNDPLCEGMTLVEIWDLCGREFYKQLAVLMVVGYKYKKDMVPDSPEIRVPASFLALYIPPVPVARVKKAAAADKDADPSAADKDADPSAAPLKKDKLDSATMKVCCCCTSMVLFP